MINAESKIGMGGGCHWCTEAVFQSLIGVNKVEQGYIASTGENSEFSEAVIVYFDNSLISLEKLIEIHLYTHKSTSNHSMRKKYRSAVYTFSKAQYHQVQNILKILQNQFDDPLVTAVLQFNSFKPSREELRDYYLKDPEKPFCKRFIVPKLHLLRKEFAEENKSIRS